MFDQGKLIAAICASPVVLERSGVGRGRRITSYPMFKGRFKEYQYELEPEGGFVVDGNLITSRGPGTALRFAVAIVEYLVDEKMAKQVADNVLIKY